ncbi:adh short domain containing protein [Asbolus verrucosus]|uniref:Adh short domain containing protein n=1 Tax=Asbolus verrucosus TaxID=1661398 RepID=A0A482VVT3_ASBVE|nr:adh short domain containing protein [Asbolus verrucosus]
MLSLFTRVGIGYQVCLNLASRGCRVIIADKDDSEKSKNRIIALTQNPNIISKYLDLSSFKSVRDFADDFKGTEGRLDILVNNAGISVSSLKPTEDGLDLLMQVNYLGPFLLTHLLIDLLKKSAPSRIVFTSSCLAFLGDLKSNDVYFTTSNSCSSFTTLNSYSNSKLATLIASDIFAKKLKYTGVTSNSLHPGLVLTNIFKALKKIENTGSISEMFFNICHFFFGKSIWEGAQTTTHLAVCEDLDGVTGEYFWDCRRFVKPRRAYDEEMCQKIWELSENHAKLLPHEKI